MTPAEAKRLVDDLINAYLRYVMTGSLEDCNEYLNLRMQVCQGLIHPSLQGCLSS